MNRVMENEKNQQEKNRGGAKVDNSNGGARCSLASIPGDATVIMTEQCIQRIKSVAKALANITGERRRIVRNTGSKNPSFNIHRTYLLTMYTD